MQFQRFPGKRMLELQFPCVQEHALQALLRQSSVELEVAVLVIARDRKSEMGEMDADLMGTAGQELRRQQRSEEHTSELQSRLHLVCRLLLEKKKKEKDTVSSHKQTQNDVH